GCPARLSAPDGERRRLGLDAPGVAGAVPAGRAAPLLPARLAEHPQPGQAERVVPGALEEGLGVVPRAVPEGLRAADAAAARVGPAAADVGVAAGAGREAVRPVEGVRRGLLAPRRPPDEQHAGPGDALDEPVLRRRPAP